jgi:hypothetical protein
MPSPSPSASAATRSGKSGICEGGGFAGRRLGLRHGYKLTTADQASLLASDLPRSRNSVEEYSSAYFDLSGSPVPIFALSLRGSIGPAAIERAECKVLLTVRIEAQANERCSVELLCSILALDRSASGRLRRRASS